MNKVWQPDVSSHRQTALETNSGPLSLRMYFGTPRVRNSHSNTPTTTEAGIERYVENPLSTKVLRGEFREGDTIIVDLGDEGLTFTAGAAKTVAR